MIEVDVAKSRHSFSLSAKFTTGPGVTALFGPSGAGKSTLTELITGQADPDRGRISVAGRVLFDDATNVALTPGQRRIGMVFQDALLFPHLSVARNLTYPIWAGGRRGAIGTDKVIELLDIDHLLGRRPHQLSGGERQRVAIGRALLSDPSLLVMDEPLSSLDERRKAEILPFIEKLRDEISLPILYISHAMEEVTRLANYLVILRDGKVAADGEITKVLATTNIGALTGLRMTGSILSGIGAEHDAKYRMQAVTVDGQVFHVLHDRVEPGTQLRIRIRARDVILAKTRPADISVRNVLSGTVCSIEAAAEDGMAEIMVKLQQQCLRAGITRHALAELALASGDPVFALVKTASLERGVTLVGRPFASENKGD